MKASGASNAEVEVDFVGDYEVRTDPIGEEVEVTFEEEIDRSDFVELPPLPEYEMNPWLSVLPVLCALVLLWNVSWRAAHVRSAGRKKP